MGFVLSRSHRIEPLPEPSFLGPGPVIVRVGVELRRFHFDLTLAQQSACQMAEYENSIDFSEIDNMAERKPLLATNGRQILNVRWKSRASQAWVRPIRERRDPNQEATWDVFLRRQQQLSDDDHDLTQEKVFQLRNDLSE